MKGVATFSIFGLVALAGIIIVLQPAWLCGIANIGCEGGHARDCLRARGATTEFTPGVSPSGDSISAHLGGKEEIVGAENVAELELILECVDNAYRKVAKKDNYTTKTAIQIGLVERQWRDGSVALDIIEPTQSLARDQLMNLAFGPASGSRLEIIQRWCSENTSCVSCNEQGDESSYAISLKDSAKFEKRYNGTAPLSGDRKEPFQLVEKDETLATGIGRRVIYTCASK